MVLGVNEKVRAFPISRKSQWARTTQFGPVAQSADIFLASRSNFISTGFCFVLFVLRQYFSMEPWLPWNYIDRRGWPQTHRNSPASVSQVLELKACATIPDIPAASEVILENRPSCERPFFRCLLTQKAGGYVSNVGILQILVKYTINLIYPYICIWTYMSFHILFYNYMLNILYSSQTWCSTVPGCLLNDIRTYLYP